jgi:3-dehydroquinate dehydratase type I
MSRPKTLRIPWQKPVLLVGCVSTPAGMAMAGHVRCPVDLIEFRVDTLLKAGVERAAILRALAARRHPVLLTLRTSEEGGNYPWKSSERILLFRELMPEADAVDVELANADLCHEVLKEARLQKKGIILSAHSIRRKITKGRGQRWIGEFRSYRAQVYKMAALARTAKDLRVLVQLLLDNPKLRMAVMAIGPMAAVSRRVLPLLGSRLAYGYLDVPSAPNQPAAAELKAFLDT